jgi:hypothetical protein
MYTKWIHFTYYNGLGFCLLVTTVIILLKFKI